MLLETFHEKKGSKKDRNCRDLKKVEDIKKRWQEHRRTIQKGLNDPDNHKDVVTHLEPDILECEGKWASGSFVLVLSRSVVSDSL